MWLSRIASKCKRLIQVCAILALPIGINSGDENQTDIVYGLYGGAGKYSSIIESCEGPTRSVDNTFVEGAAALYMRVPQKSQSPFVVGVTGALWYSDITLASFSNYDVEQEKYHDQHVGRQTFAMVTPSISYEGEDEGIEVGLLIGRYPGKFNDEIEFMPHITGHIRVGKADRMHLGISLNENLPLSSGGGAYNFGLAFPVGRKFNMYHAITFGGYHGGGLTHQFRIRLDKSSSLDVNLRWSPVREGTGTFEGGIGVGIRRYIGR